MSKTFVFITGIVLLLSGTAFRAAPATVIAAQQSESDATREMLERMAREANTKRHQDIRDDTEKLFQLASELKSAVDKSNEHVLSLDVVRKADEVEKLAKKVKDKMKESIGPPPRPEPTPRNLSNPLSRQ